MSPEQLPLPFPEDPPGPIIGLPLLDSIRLSLLTGHSLKCNCIFNKLDRFTQGTYHALMEYLQR